MRARCLSLPVGVSSEVDGEHSRNAPIVGGGATVEARRRIIDRDGHRYRRRAGRDDLADLVTTLQVGGHLVRGTVRARHWRGIGIGIRKAPATDGHHPRKPIPETLEWRLRLLAWSAG